MNKALGLIETIGLVCAIEAADAAVKAANVSLLGYENARGGGKITVKLVGDVGAVQAAVAAGVAAAQRIGKVYSQSVIPRPHEEIDALIKQVNRGLAKETPALKPNAEEVPAQHVDTIPETPEAGTNGSNEEPDHCAAITQANEPCKLPARPGSKYCRVHRKLETAA